MGSMCWVGNVGIHATGHLGLKMEPMYGIHIWTSDVKNPCVDLREPTTPCHSDLKFQQRIGSIHLTGVCGIPAWTGGALHARSLGPKSHPCKPSIHDQDLWNPYVTKEPSPRMRRVHVYPTLQPLGVTVVNVQDPYIGRGMYGIHMRPKKKPQPSREKNTPESRSLGLGDGHRGRGQMYGSQPLWIVLSSLLPWLQSRPVDPG